MKNLDMQIEFLETLRPTIYYQGALSEALKYDMLQELNEHICELERAKKLVADDIKTEKGIM